MTMPTMPADALEIITLSVEDGEAAEAGGATRLEVVRDILADGLTPDRRLVEQLLERVSIPLRVMVRPRNTFLVGDERHQDEIARDAALFADLPVDVVTGYVRAAEDGSAEIDEAALALVADRAPSARITFHRAVERISGDPTAALRRCPAVDRVLSGGGAGSWASRADALVHLQGAVTPVRVIVGGGVSMEGIAALVSCASLRELHVGRLARTGESYDAPVDARIVETLRHRWLASR